MIHGDYITGTLFLILYYFIIFVFLQQVFTSITIESLRIAKSILGDDVYGTYSWKFIGKKFYDYLRF